MKRIFYELLPFKVHEHLSSCQRGIRDAAKCKFCTKFFLEHCNEMILVKNATHLFSYQCSNMEVHSLFEKVQTSDVYLNVFYKTSDFISHGPKNHNYGEIFIELINNPFAFYISYLEIYSCLYFNLPKDVTDFVVFNCFSRQRLEKKLNKDSRDDVHRTLINCYCMSLKKLIRYLNVNIDPLIIEKIFNDYIPRKDYDSRQITIIKKNGE